MRCGISEPKGGKGALAYKPARQIFFILPRRVVCASRSDASMAALVRAAAARRGRTEGWDMGKGGAGAGGWRNDGGASPLCSARGQPSSGHRAWSRLKTSIALQ